MASPFRALLVVLLIVPLVAGSAAGETRGPAHPPEQPPRDGSVPAAAIAASSAIGSVGDGVGLIVTVAAKCPRSVPHVGVIAAATQAPLHAMDEIQLPCTGEWLKSRLVLRGARPFANGATKLEVRGRTCLADRGCRTTNLVRDAQTTPSDVTAVSMPGPVGETAPPFEVRVDGHAETPGGNVSAKTGHWCRRDVTFVVFYVQVAQSRGPDEEPATASTEVKPACGSAWQVLEHVLPATDTAMRPGPALVTVAGKACVRNACRTVRTYRVLDLR